MAGRANAQAPAAAFTPRVADGFSTDWDHLTMEKRELAPNVWYMHASGGNTVVLTGADGTLVVDAAYAQVFPLLKKTLMEMHAYPVKYVLCSHHHSDHSGANGALEKDGAVIVGHENCRAHMMVPSVSSMTHMTSPPAPTENWPTITYSKSMTFHFDGEEVELEYYGPAHTDDDTIIYFKKANVVHLGDVFVNNLYPSIDIRSGGRVDGYFPVIDAALARMDDKTAVIPGHGPVATKAQLKAYRDMIQTVRDRVAAQIATGKTLDQIKAMKLSAEFDPQYATNRVDGDRFVTLVWESLQGKPDQ
jgi:glyoxylase-like metal-dependent hydrolase (beta-lactamase superfamily II)